jgi:hypothetical protein
MKMLPDLVNCAGRGGGEGVRNDPSTAFRQKRVRRKSEVFSEEPKYEG